MSLLQENQDVRQRIADHLAKKGIKRTFLAEKIQVSNGHLRFILQCERPLTDELLEKINTALETKFERAPEEQVKIAR